MLYENQLLRQWCNIPPEQLLDLSEMKLKDRVSSTKAVSEKRQLEKEILDLEDERLALKMRLRSLASLASEKSLIFTGLEPDQMLQLEQIAESMRRGKLELPEVDVSRDLRKQVEKLEKELQAKDTRVSDFLQGHVDRKVDSVIEKTSDRAALKEKCLLLEKEVFELKAAQESQLAALTGQLAALPGQFQQAAPTQQAAPQGGNMLQMASGLARMMSPQKQAAGGDAANAALQQQLQQMQQAQQQQVIFSFGGASSSRHVMS